MHDSTKLLGDAASYNCPLGNQVVVFSMSAYPEPENPVRHVDAEGTIMQTDADGSVATDVLQAQ